MISLVCIACLVSGVALSLRTNALRQTKEIRIGLTPATLVADANRSLNVGILVIPVGTLAALDSDANTAYILNSVVVKYLKERAKLFLLGQDIQIESSLDSTHIMFAFQARHAMEQLFRM